MLGFFTGAGRALKTREQLVWAAGVFFLTVVLHLVAFPPGQIPEAAFVLAVPALFWAFRRPSAKLYFGVLLAAQTLIWFVLLFWLRHVTWAGLLALAPLLGAIGAAWFALARAVLPDVPARNAGSRILILLGLAGAWVVLEWVRTFLFSGFPWLPLAASQWQRPLLLPISAFTGAYGVSFLLIFFNLGLAAYVQRGFAFYRQGLRRLSPEFMLATALLIAGSFGFLSDSVAQKRRDWMNVAFVQPYIPQSLKWDPAEVRQILGVLERYTLITRAYEPDLILWPEAVTPLAVHPDTGMDAWIESLANQAGAPLLLGAVAIEDLGGPDEAWINGAFLAEPERGLHPRYYGKRKLVPFGEYVPLPRLLGWMKKIVPIGDDFTRGVSAEPMPVPVEGRRIPVGVLICYEDVFPGLARRSVLEGAEVLAVLTNNAWYGEGGAAYQHAAHSVLRAVETRRPVLRSGNGGWSGWIDEYGNVRAVLLDERGSVYYRGADAHVVSRDERWIGRLTFYVQHGDWFVAASAGLLLLAGIAAAFPAPPMPAPRARAVHPKFRSRKSAA